MQNTNTKENDGEGNNQASRSGNKHILSPTPIDTTETGPQQSDERVGEIKQRYPDFFAHLGRELDEFLVGCEGVRALLGWSIERMYGPDLHTEMTLSVMSQELDEGDEVCPSWLLRESLRVPNRRRFSEEDSDCHYDRAREDAWSRAVSEWKESHPDEKPTIGELLRLAEKIWERKSVS